MEKLLLDGVEKKLLSLVFSCTHTALVLIAIEIYILEKLLKAVGYRNL
jgi:hypothetical protein